MMSPTYHSVTNNHPMRTHLIAGGNSIGDVVIWDDRYTAHELSRYNNLHDAPVSSLAFRGDNSVIDTSCLEIYSASFDGSLVSSKWSGGGGMVRVDSMYRGTAPTNRQIIGVMDDKALVVPLSSQQALLMVRLTYTTLRSVLSIEV